MYEPGEIVAVAYTNGKETGRTILKSAGITLNLKCDADRDEIEANDGDLSFITVSLVDNNGILRPLADREVSVKVEGAGILQGFGSGNPKPERNFSASTQRSFDGKALAVIRPISSGIIHVTFEAEGCAAQTVQIKVR